MKAKKIIGSLVISLLAISLLAGCGSTSTTSSSGQKKTVGVLMVDFSDQFEVYMMQGMKAEAAKYPNINFIYEDAKEDANTQTSEMEDLIARNVNAIILMPVDSKSSIPMVKDAVKANIPIITVNRTLSDQSLALSYVGSDDIQAGEMEMQQMAKLLNGKGNIAILEGQMGQEPTIQREQGIKNILAKYPNIHIVADQAANWDRATGMSVAENWLQSSMKINAIVAHNDEMAIGAEKAIASTSKTGKILVCGIDATPEGLQAVQSGAQAFTVFQDANAEGKGSIDTAVKVVQGEKVPQKDIIPYELVTPDKVPQYQAKYKK